MNSRHNDRFNRRLYQVSAEAIEEVARKLAAIRLEADSSGKLTAQDATPRRIVKWYFLEIDFFTEAVALVPIRFSMHARN